MFFFDYYVFFYEQNAETIPFPDFSKMMSRYAGYVIAPKQCIALHNFNLIMLKFTYIILIIHLQHVLALFQYSWQF